MFQFHQMGMATIVLLFIIIIITTTTTTTSISISAQSSSSSGFKCSSSSSCEAIIDYVSPNATTLSHIKNLFNLKNLRSILATNNFPLSTPPNQALPPNQSIKVPIPCICTNGTGKSNKRPIYTVVHGDGLYHIAAEVFSGLVTYQDIQAANNIKDANLIKVGQKLWIPLPCSCDQVQGEMVVHYGHLVAAGTTVEGIAQQFGTSQDILLKLNGLATPNDLKAGILLDVPLKACTSQLSNNTLDYPLLAPNGTYVFTAANCVMCKCDAANNWTLQCEASGLKSSLWPSCPSMQCQGVDNLYLGNTTTSLNNPCDGITCSYAGYTNQTILITTTSLDSTCPAAGSKDRNLGVRQRNERMWKSILMMIIVIY